MKRFIVVIAALLMAVAMVACTASEASPASETTVTPTTVHTEPACVDIGGSTLDTKVTALNLQETTYSLDKLLVGAPQLSSVSEIKLGTTDFTAEQLTSLQNAFPAAEIRYSLDILGQTYPSTETCLDFSSVTPDQAPEVLPKLPLLPDLQQIRFVAPDGSCAWGICDIPILDQLRTAAPNADFVIHFDLFGQTVTSEDSRIEYIQVPIGNEGVATVRAVLPYLSACEYLLIDGCGVDHEVMASLRDDFPETKIVWRIWFGYPDYNSMKLLRSTSVLTDTHRIRTTRVNDGNSYLLKYCVDAKYVDFGHNASITDFSFLACMPKLEVAILALTGCSDLTPLASCPELEYLEVYRSEVTDLSPLANCTKLKHLNFGDLPISDITCLYGLELERMRGCATNVPEEQFEEYSRLHPNCQMLNEGYSPSRDGWRYDENNEKVPRYALLQEQMEYRIDSSYGIP